MVTKRTATSRQTARTRRLAERASTGAARPATQPEPRPSQAEEQRQPAAAAEQRQARASAPAQRRPEGNANARRIKRTIATWRQRGVIAFGAIMAVGLVVGLLFFARPTVSMAENRNLTKFPEFTAERFLNGSYFTDLSLWYADTYPLREPMVQANLKMNGLMGIEPETRMIGGNRTSDELPVPGADSEVKPTHEHNVSAPEARARAAGLEDQIKDGVYVTDGACYTLYYFDDGATREYAGVINDAAEMLKGKATVYSVIIPTNAGVMLEDETLKQLGVPNQGQAIDYFYSLMTDDVITVPTFDILREHKDEYLYFRTDHHWTQLGAYYVYENFCKVKGIEPAPYFEWEELVFKPFWGEYDGVASLDGFEADSVVARVPQGTKTMKYWTDDLDPSTETEGPVIADFTDLKDEGANRYNCFVCGNQPMSYIENPTVTDGSSCLVIKDSFGNPFVSTLVDSYQHIYTIDFRFTSQKLLDMVEKYNIQDVIFENVIMFAGTYDAVDLLSAIVYPDKNTDDSSSSAASASAESASSSSAASTTTEE